MNHTLEPWVLTNWENSNYDAIAIHGGENGTQWIAEVVLDHDVGDKSAAEMKANANRIVECVNACAGINPSAVPKMLAACKMLSIISDDDIPWWIRDAFEESRIAVREAEASQ